MRPVRANRNRAMISNRAILRSCTLGSMVEKGSWVYHSSR